MATLYYVHDPMCSWCWAYQPVLAQVRKALSGQLDIVNLLGGLAEDSDQPMPAVVAEKIQAHWRQIEKTVGVSFNFDFWRDKNIVPKRSTYPACRAVLAAQCQGAEQLMIEAIQNAYYQRAMNPSEEETLLQLADELDLDFERFMTDLHSPTINARLNEQVSLTRAMPIEGFPSWVLAINDQWFAIALDYHSAQNTLARIVDVLKNNKSD